MPIPDMRHGDRVSRSFPSMWIRMVVVFLAEVHVFHVPFVLQARCVLFILRTCATDTWIHKTKPATRFWTRQKGEGLRRTTCGGSFRVVRGPNSRVRASPFATDLEQLIRGFRCLVNDDNSTVPNPVLLFF